MKEIISKVVNKLPETIETDKDFQLATKAVKYLNGHLKTAEAKRKRETKPLLEAKREIDSSYKIKMDPAKALVAKVKGMITDYYHKIEERQVALEEKTMAELKPGEQALVPDLIEDIRKTDDASVLVKQIVKFKFVTAELEKCFTIKQSYLREYVKEYGLPEFLEGHVEDRTTIR